jgi:hypothetical protein
MCPVGSSHEIDSSGCATNKCVAMPDIQTCPEFAFEACPSGYSHAVDARGCVMPGCVPDQAGFNLSPWMLAALAVILVLMVRR